MLYKRKWSSKVLPSQHCWCNQIDVISLRKFFHLENHCSTPFSFSFLMNSSSFFSFLVSSSLFLCISFYFLIIYFPPCVPHKFIFFSSLFSFLLTFTLFLYIYSCFNYKKNLLGGLHGKESSLETLSFDRLYIQNEEEKDSFLFYLSSHSWFQVDWMYVIYTYSTCNHNFLCSYNIITLIKSRFDILHKIFTFTTRMFNTIQTHINGLFITFTLIVKLACIEMGIDFYMQCSSETLNLERCLGKL